jgi:hypothetical protein
MLAPIILGLAIALPAPTFAAEDARGAAERFGAALVDSDIDALRPLLPARGKVHLRLQRLGPEQGYFSPGQVQQVLRAFLAEGKVLSFEVRRVEDEPSLALVHGFALLTDRRGERAEVRLHLALQPEQGRWVLREIRELAS